MKKLAIETEFTYTPGQFHTHIQNGLWMSGTADDDTIYEQDRSKCLDSSDYFDSVVTLYSHANPVPWNIQEMRYGFPDSHVQDIDLVRLGEVVVWAYKKWQAGDRVLIRCQAGLNRSGLVMALVLMYNGATSVEAIRWIRKRRSADALFNANYVAWLRKHGASYIKMLKDQENGIKLELTYLSELLNGLPTSGMESR
jgi:protein-tyrosine phosphatase